MTPPLVAVAHGSRDPGAARATEDLLAAVRRARPGLDVRASYLDHASPLLADALTGLVGRGAATGQPDEPGEPDAVVVPLLLGAAYHSGVDIPRAITGSGARAVQADVLGPDRLLLDALDRRLAEAGVAPGDPSTAVVLAAAGSTSPDAVAAVRLMAREWARRDWWDVTAAFASAARPSVRDAVAGLRTRGAPRVAVASYLLFPGLFADALMTAGADLTTAPLSAAPEVVRVVLARYDAAATQPPRRQLTGRVNRR